MNNEEKYTQKISVFEKAQFLQAVWETFRYLH